MSGFKAQWITSYQSQNNLRFFKVFRKKTISKYANGMTEPCWIFSTVCCIINTVNTGGDQLG